MTNEIEMPPAWSLRGTATDADEYTTDILGLERVQQIPMVPVQDCYASIDCSVDAARGPERGANPGKGMHILRCTAAATVSRGEFNYR